MATNTGKQYERLAQAVFNVINNAERVGMETIIVQHDVILQGKDTEHQIDVYWEVKVGIITHRVIIQAKDWGRKVPKNEMLAFDRIIRDIPGCVGIFVSKSGFQSGAVEVAVANNITLCELRSPIASDWDGFIKIVNISMHLLTPLIGDISFFVDKEWAMRSEKENSIGKGRRCSTDRIIIFPNGEKKMLQKVFDEISNEVGVGEEERTVEFEDGTILQLSDNEQWKINGLRGRFGLHESVSDMVIDGGHFVDYVLKNVLSGEVKMFNKHELN